MGKSKLCIMLWFSVSGLLRAAGSLATDLQPVCFNNPDLTVDLGVGLWAQPLPMDWDNDGDWDLVVTYNDVPNKATLLFENISGNVKMPIFRAPVKVGVSYNNIQISYVDGKPRLLIPEQELVDFRSNQFNRLQRIYPEKKIHPGSGRIRANQWKYCDYDGDSKQDLIVGVDDWSEYGWDEGYDENGRWKMGPGRGFVYWLRNNGSNENPQYLEPQQILADGKAVETYAMPTPNFADFDSDGDLDLICGEFLDRLTYFQNIGTRTAPQYAVPRFLTHQGRIVAMDGCMIDPVAIDWDKDGDVDLVIGSEDGSVALVENSGAVAQGMPNFLPPKNFQQQAGDLHWGVLVTPYSYDWDGDGDEDLVCGNASGYIGFIENLDGGNPPRWAAPRCLEAGGNVIHILAGYNGSIQGPCEAKWGYVTLSVADWDGDKLPDIVINSIWGKVEWFRNIGTRTQPRLAAAQPITVAWPGKTPKPEWTWWQPQGQELVTQWRTTPLVIDYNRDGLNDLLMLDTEGYLVLFQRKSAKGLVLLPGQRIFCSDGATTFDWIHKEQGRQDSCLRLNNQRNGKSGRRKFCMTDWNRDGRLDLILNSINVNILENRGEKNGLVVFHDTGAISDIKLAGHTTSPTVVDWDRNGVPDLLIGAEDGRFYYFANPKSH